MARDVFLIPVDEQMFSETVIAPVPAEDLPSQFTRKKRIWGIRDSELNRRFYEKLESEDVLLFYNDFQYIGIGKAGEKFTSSEFTSTYWGQVDAELLFEIGSFLSIEIPIKTINQVFGYTESFLPQSFRRVSNSARTKMRQKFGSVSEFETLIRSGELSDTNPNVR